METPVDPAWGFQFIDAAHVPMTQDVDRLREVILPLIDGVEPEVEGKFRGWLLTPARIHTCTHTFTHPHTRCESF